MAEALVEDTQQKRRQRSLFLRTLLVGPHTYLRSGKTTSVKVQRPVLKINIARNLLKTLGKSLCFPGPQPFPAVK